MSSTSTKLFTPIGTRAIGQAWSNVIKAFEMADVNAQPVALRILAATPGDPDIIKKFLEWKKETDDKLVLMQSEQVYSQTDNIPKQKRVNDYKTERYLTIYANLIQLLKEKDLLEFQNFSAKPMYYNRPKA